MRASKVVDGRYGNNHALRYVYYSTEREIMEQIERDYEYEYEQELARRVRRKNRLAWEEAEADRDWSEREIEDDRSH